MLTQSTLQIFRLHEYLRATRPRDSTSTPGFGGLFVEELKRKFCEKAEGGGNFERKKKKKKRGGGELRPTTTMS